MAEELGLEYTEPDTEVDDAVVSDSTVVEEFVAKEKSGFSIGGAASVGFLSGASFTSVPLGATVVLKSYSVLKRSF